MILRRQSNAGFTLIELVISAALMALILTSAYVCLHAGMVSRKQMEPRLEALQNARVAMALIVADLRTACPLPQTSGFVGMHRTIDDVTADNIDFATHNYTPRREHEGDFCEESLFLEKEKETGEFVLWRRRNPTLAMDPLVGGSREELARGLRGLTFEYYDGLEWYDSWGEIKPGKKKTSSKKRSNLADLPQAVRVTLQFDVAHRTTDKTESSRVPEPLSFQTVVRLNFAGISTGGFDASAGPDTAQGGGE
ncbi:MAG: gspJ [Verrucomicrobiales bacterium]|nr:gspJ [Verrucomicrobiales bacterium]